MYQRNVSQMMCRKVSGFALRLFRLIPKKKHRLAIVTWYQNLQGELNQTIIKWLQLQFPAGNGTHVFAFVGFHVPQ